MTADVGLAPCGGRGGGGRYELALPLGPLELLSSKPISVFGSNGSKQCVLGLEGQGFEGVGPGLQTHRDFLPPHYIFISINELIFHSKAVSG